MSFGKSASEFITEHGWSAELTSIVFAAFIQFQGLTEEALGFMEGVAQELEGE